MKKETSEEIKMTNKIITKIFKWLGFIIYDEHWEKEFDSLIIYTEKLLQQKEEGEVFINHISEHIKETEEVRCITCGKTSEAIHKEWKSGVK